jgi:hypothetical protein
MTPGRMDESVVLFEIADGCVNLAIFVDGWDDDPFKGAGRLNDVDEAIVSYSHS